MSGQLYIISAPSGAGKTSLVSALIGNVDNLCVTISHTTRAQRSSEANGVNYHFVNQDEFDRMVAADEFLEHAHVFDHSYGTSRTEVESNLKTGVDVILEIDWQGAQQVKQRYASAKSIFILPPSYDALQQRLKDRGENDNNSIARRMHDAVAEMSHYNEFEFIVINDDFDTALFDLQSIVRAHQLRSEVQLSKISSLLNDLLEQ